MPVITTSQELRKRVDALKKESFITIDTEFLREKTYYPLLCLIQIAGEKDVFAVDSLAKDIDLTPIWEILDDPKIVKVFHACSQDIEIVLHEHHKVPQSVFDTQIAAQILGYGENIGYGNLVTKICKVSLDKSSRHTDWSKRPLSEKQIKYALSDVTYLRDIYLTLKEQLESRERVLWFEEEMEKLSDPNCYIPHHDDAWKKLRIKSGSDEYLSIVKELATWRELRSQLVNKPRNWVMKSDAILEIASIVPKKDKDLDNLRFFKTSKSDVREEILAAVERGLSSKPPKLIKKKILPKGAGPLVDLLKVLLKTQCDYHDIAPSVVASIENLEKIATVTDLCKNHPDIPPMHGWRYEIFGKFAIALSKGELALSAENSRIILIKPKFE